MKEEYGKARPMLQRAVGINERTLGLQHPAFAKSLSSLASFHVQMADFEQAERELERALAILESTVNPNDRGVARALNNLGNTYLTKKDYERAELLEQRALTMYEKLDGPENRSLVYPLLNLGRIAHERLLGRDLGRALEMYSRALRILEKSAGTEQLTVGVLLNNMANVYKAKRDYDTPLALYQRALNIAEKSGGPYHGLAIVSLGNIANLYIARHDIANAIPFQRRVDERLEGALALNLAIGSERQKLAYFQSFAERTERTISLHFGLARQEPTTGALAALVLLQRKGRILDAVSGGLTALRQRFDVTDQRLLDRLNATTAQLAKLALDGPQKSDVDGYRRRLSGLEDERERLEAEMSERSAEFRAQSQPVSLAAVQAAIPPHAALIEFAVYRPFDPTAEMNTEAYGERRYAVCVMRRDDDVQWKDLGKAREIDLGIDQLRRALRDPKRSDVRDLARLVDEQVMRPIRALIGDADQLLVSPDSDLSLIPFEALVDEHGRYLVERYAVTYLTSGRDLLRLQVARTSKNVPVVIADPSFGEPPVTQRASTDVSAVTQPSPRGRRRSITNADTLSSLYFAPLGGTAEESRAIKLLLPDAKVFTHDQATESALRRTEAPRILHVATHGFFLTRASASSSNPTATGTRAITANATLENPLLRSGLAFAGANVRSNTDDDGIVTALEASGLNLWGTKLVTLSACDTGVGEVKNGEGVYGLRRAFVLAGTETLVMSLWPVSDYMTRELMTAYYTGLTRGKGRGEALRDVQLVALKRKGREHPFYWASFIQSGEWADLEGRRHSRYERMGSRAGEQVTCGQTGATNIGRSCSANAGHWVLPDRYPVATRVQRATKHSRIARVQPGSGPRVGGSNPLTPTNVFRKR